MRPGEDMDSAAGTGNCSWLLAALFDLFSGSCASQLPLYVCLGSSCMSEFSWPALKVALTPSAASTSRRQAVVEEEEENPEGLESSAGLELAESIFWSDKGNGEFAGTLRLIAVDKKLRSSCS